MISIRLMQDTDLPAIVNIEQQVFSNPWPLEAFAHTNTNDSYVLTEDDALHGYIMYHTVLDEAMIINFAIDPLRQKHGLGAYLLSYTLDLMQNQNIRNIYLDVRESNLAARNLYDKYGFQAIGKRKHYYTLPDEDAVVMHKKIEERN